MPLPIVDVLRASRVESLAGPVRGRGRWAGHAGLVVLVALFIWTGASGQAWLFHWDEDKIVDDLRSSLDQGTLLPGRYHYPSATFWTVALAFTPEVVSVAAEPPGERLVRLIPRLDGTAFRLRLRRLFLALTALSVVWVYLAALAATGSPPIALLAATLTGGSWEVAYHARWPAPDGLVMQFAALTLLIAITAVQRSSSFLWKVAAIAAGAAVAAKYTAWPLVACLIVARIAARPDRRWRDAGALGVVAVVTFLIITPGAVLQFLTFVRDVRFEARHYATEHAMHTVGRGLPHLLADGRYLLMEVWSPAPVLSVLLALLLAPGALSVARSPRALPLLLIGFPAAYLLFLANYRVMIVRNLLPLIPFLAVVLAMGAAWLVERIPARSARYIVAGVLAAITIYNLAYIVAAARTRATPDKAIWIDRFREDLNRNVYNAVCGTPRVFKTVGGEDSHLQRGCSGASHVAFMQDDVLPDAEFHLIRYAHVYAPNEVNYRYYPDWNGADTIFVATLDHARALHVTIPVVGGRGGEGALR